jgi:DnaJ-class molecular chaperone
MKRKRNMDKVENIVAIGLIRCPDCHGKGICRRCKYDNDKKCEECGGSGICKTCNGQGSI